MSELDAVARAGAAAATGLRVLLLALVAGGCGAAEPRAADPATQQVQATAPAEAVEEGPPTSYSEAELRAHVDVATALADEICACRADDCVRPVMDTYRPQLRRIRQPGDEQAAQARQFERTRTCLRLRELDERERNTSLLIKLLREL